MSFQGPPPGYRPGPPQPASPVPYMGQSPGHPPHPVSPPPYMGPAPQHPPVQMGPPPTHAPPLAAAPGATRTVFGLPLEPGERVLYYKYISGTGSRVTYILLGIPMILLIGIGFFLIYLGITHKKQFAYAQVVTNRRIFALDGNGTEMEGIRWEDVAGLNKVSTSTGLVRKVGARNAAGATCMFGEDLATAERVITQLAQSPAQRELWPEVPFDAQVH